jgi:hypothetical protein
MAANTLVKDVLYRVSDALHDLSPQFQRWTSRSLVVALNDGQIAIAKYIPTACSRVDAVKLAPGTKQSISSIASGSVIPGDGSTPAAVNGNALTSVIRNMGANGSTVGRAIRLVDREVLDLNTPDWHTTTGTAVSEFVFDPRSPKNFYVNPGVPSTSNVWVELSYLADPAAVPPGGTYDWSGSDTTKISIDDKFVDDLVSYILARAYLKDAENAANAGLYATYAQQFVSSINAQAAAITGVNPNLKTLPMADTPKA